MGEIGAPDRNIDVDIHLQYHRRSNSTNHVVEDSGRQEERLIKAPSEMGKACSGGTS
jgi:hypothetical protein